MTNIDIEISEVGPRDGLQSIKTIMSTEDKKAWIAAEAAAGVPEIEVGSFVPPSVIPQLADTAEIVLPTSSAADDTEPGPLPVPPHGPFTTAPDGPADDLKRISGVGPKLEALLNEQGITTFAQLAALSDEDVDALQERLSQFPGRIRRDDWVAQATRFVEEG